MYRICLIGHRPKDLTQYMPDGASPYDMHNSFWMASIREFFSVISSQLSKHPEGLELHSGMALGADTAWAGAIVVARNRFGSDKIRFVADVPFPTQANRWHKRSQQIWHQLIDLADEVVYTSQGSYSPALMEARNQQMILPSDLCIAFWDVRQYGGTFNGVQDAKKSPKTTLLRINPADIRF